MLRFIHRSIAIVMILAAAAAAAHPEDLDKLLADLSSEDAGLREAAVQAIALSGAEAVTPLVALIAGEDHTAASGARVALQRLVHRASAPGNDFERMLVAKSLLNEIRRSIPAVTRCWLLRLVSFAGQNESVPILAGLLGDHDVGEMALFALARIPGEESAAALRKALPAAAPERKAGILLALGARREMAACDAVIACTKDGDPAVRRAAVAALGRIPAPGAASALETIEAGGSEPESACARTALLELAASLLETGDVKGAIAIYERRLAAGPAVQDRCAGLIGLARARGPQAVPVLLEAVKEGPPGLSATAASVLARMPGKSVTMAMAEAVAAAQPSARAVLIHGLGRRSDAASTHALQAVIASMKSAPDPVRVEILEALGNLEDSGLRGAFLGATHDGNEDVAVAAIDALGRLRNPAANPRLFEIAREGSAGEKAAALRACVRIADGVSDASRDEALEIYCEILVLARGDDEKKLVLSRLGGLGHTGAIAVIKPFVRGENEALRKSAAAALFPLAVKLAEDKEREGARAEAAELLTDVVKLADNADVVQKAAIRLREMGVDVDVPVRPGCVANFWLLGPLPGRSALHTSDALAVDGPVDVSRTVTFAGKDYEWVHHPPDHIHGMIDLLLAVAQAEDCGAYAYAEVEIGEALDATLKIGSDDDVYCWLNGALVHSFEGGRGWAYDQDSADVHLEAGTNTILLKVLNGGGGWAASVRIVGRDGNPVEFEERKL